MIGTIDHLALAMAAFIVSHVVLSSTGVRDRLAEALGERGFLALYSTVAAVVLAWAIAAWRAAPTIELWPTAAFARHLAMTVMALASVLVVAGFATRNPSAVGAGPSPPVATGILKVTRHPVMWGIGLWALVHLAANGDAAALIFFGGLAALALGGTTLIDAKRRMRLGAAWAEFEARTSNLPFAALISGRARVTLAEIGWWRIALGLVLYAVFLFLHRPVIGVAPVPALG